MLRTLELILAIFAGLAGAYFCGRTLWAGVKVLSKWHAFKTPAERMAVRRVQAIYMTLGSVGCFSAVGPYLNDIGGALLIVMIWIGYLIHGVFNGY